MKKLNSLSIFFPFYNDAGTVEEMIKTAFKYGLSVSESLEVIAIHGGHSQDNTYDEILRMKHQFPQLRIINKIDNTQGYAVIKYGFLAAQHEWVFYTDGDGQYDLKDLAKLVNKQAQTQADVVNGFKLNRDDTWQRQLFGSVFQWLHRTISHLPIRDIHCDFRLIRRSCLQDIRWNTQNATIISELILKLQARGAIFAEVGVKHSERKYGHSNYSVFKLSLESVQEIIWSLKFRYLNNENN